MDHATPAQGPITPRALPAHLSCDGLRRVRVGAWQQQAEISPGGSVSSSGWTWLTAEATSTEAECRQVSARFDATLGPKDADGYSSVTSKGKKVRVRNVCLPDGTDPRGPKGK